MQRQKIIATLALLATAPLLIVLAAGATAQGQDQKSAKLENIDPANIDTFYHVIAVTGASADSMSFDVFNTVVKNLNSAVF